MNVDVSPAAMRGQWLAMTPVGMAVITHVHTGDWEVEVNFTGTPEISYHPTYEAAVQAISDAADML